MLVPKSEKSKPEIEVIGSEETNGDEDEEDNEWFIEQKVPEEASVIDGCKYGFANQKTDSLQNTEVCF